MARPRRTPTLYVAISSQDPQDVQLATESVSAETLARVAALVHQRDHVEHAPGLWTLGAQAAITLLPELRALGLALTVWPEAQDRLDEAAAWRERVEAGMVAAFGPIVLRHVELPGAGERTCDRCPKLQRWPWGAYTCDEFPDEPPLVSRGDEVDRCVPCLRAQHVEPVRCAS